MRGVYYNEHDARAAAWLRELIRAGQLPAGVVDERSIEDVTPADVAGFRACHFFAGIGGWPLALRLAGWPDDAPVWTGSCPCQPFSQAGARRGVHDARHVWPAWRWLIDQCGPVTVLGEQVASGDGREWLAGVRADLDVLGYAFGAADLCAAGVAAPHCRQRLFWVADAADRRRVRNSGTFRLERCRRGRDGLADAYADRTRQHARAVHGDESEHGERAADSDNASQHCSAGGRLEHTNRARCQRGEGKRRQARRWLEHDGRLVDADQWRRRFVGQSQHQLQQSERRVQPDGSSEGGFWDGAIWIECEHGKARRIKPGIAPLVDGFPGRMELVRGYGNAIVPQVAAAFIKAVMDL